jgi:hypothetical protein
VIECDQAHRALRRRVCFRRQTGKHMLTLMITAHVKGFGCRPLTAVPCEGFRMPAVDGGAEHLGCRRPKASKERNRDGGRAAVARALWGFERRG